MSHPVVTHKPAVWPLWAGWLTLALPSLWDYLFGNWVAYSAGHEWLLIGVAAWLIWRVMFRTRR